MKHLLPRVSIVAAGLALTSVLSGCQPEDSAGTANGVPEIVIQATDNDYPMPANATAGLTQVTIDNQGKELHQIWLLQLKDGKTFDDVLAYAKTAKETDPLPSWAVPAGGPAVAAPGQKASVFVDLKEGTYAMLCNIPDAQGVPYTQKGMIKPLTVAAASGASAAEPVSSGAIQQIDFAFVAPTDAKSGKNVFEVTNDGKQGHEAVLMKLNEGATAAQIFAAFSPGGNGQPPAMPVGGVGTIPPGTSQSFPADLTAGRYALLCFLPDATTGKPHAALGMMAEFDAK